MSLDILKMLIDSACANGTISAQDRALLASKAKDLGVPQPTLDQMIQEALSPSQTQAPSTDLSSGFVTSDTPETTNPLDSSGFVTSSQEKTTPPPPNAAQSHFSDVHTLDGQGAMSLVQKGKLHGKWIVIKRIKPEYASNAKYKELFYKEFENAYHLDHPSIIRLLDKGEDAQGAYYTMEFVDGRSLTSLLKKGGMNDKLVKKIFKQILEGLAYVHKKQVFHRDLKPDNIQITYKGDNVKILDFGLAAADSFDDDLVKVGTPRYAAPEQLTKGNTVDQRADIYALGLIFLEMLTGDIQDRQAASVKNANYQHIVQKATAQNPQDRFDDCEEILEWLNKPFVAAKKAEAPVPPPPVPPKDPKDEFAGLLAQADAAFKQKDYQNAKSLYADYLTKVPNDKYASKQIELCNKKIAKSFEKPRVTEKKKLPLVPILIGVAAVALIVVLFLMKDSIFGASDDGDDNLADKPNTEKYNEHIKKADRFFDDDNYEHARDYYDSALAVISDDEYAERQRKLCDDNLSKETDLMAEADALYAAKNAVRAKLLYDSLLVSEPSNAEAKKKSDACRDIIDKSRTIKPDQSTDGMYGYVNGDDWLVIDHQYDAANPLQYKMAFVKKNGKLAFIDKKGRLLTEFRFDKIEPFNPGYKAYDNTSGEKFLVVISGNEIVLRKF